MQTVRSTSKEFAKAIRSRVVTGLPARAAALLEYGVPLFKMPPMDLGPFNSQRFRQELFRRVNGKGRECSAAILEARMKTPYGKECRFYYSDYFRGRESQECRLLENNPESDKWFPSLCQNCPVPDILMANQCKHLRLYGRVGKALFGLAKKVEVEGFCDQHFLDVQEPRVGCGHCHEADLEEIQAAEK